MASSLLALTSTASLDALAVLLDLDGVVLSSVGSLGALLPADSPAVLFSLGNLSVMPFWLLMILAPGWRVTARLMASPLVALAPALAYAALAAPGLAELLPLLMSPKLDAIAALLGTPRGATIAWMHFLAFDLLVGRQVFLDARGRAMPAWISSPVLFFVLMLGPLGFVLHLAARRWFPRAGARDLGAEAAERGGIGPG